MVSKKELIDKLTEHRMFNYAGRTYVIEEISPLEGDDFLNVDNLVND